MKKYLLTLCLTMLAVVSSWAQTGDWGIEVSQAPVYVEAEGTGTRDFTITTPDNPGGFTIEVVEYVSQGGSAKNFATASTPALKSGTTNEYTVTFSPGSAGIGISQFYIAIKQNGTEVTSTKATPFEVNVYDKDLARSIVDPSTDGVLNIDKGATLNIPIVTPSTATLTITTNTTSSNISITRDNITGNLVIDATGANVDDQVEVTLTPAGGSKDRDGNAVSAVTFTVKVVKPEIPVNNYTMMSELPVGMTYPCPITPSTGTLGTDYTASYKVEKVVNNVDVISLNETTGELKTLKVGLARATATFEPISGGCFDGYRTWSHSFDFMVMPAEFSLGTFTVTKGTKDGKTIYTPSTPVATVTPSVSPLPGYAIRYSLEGAIPNAVEVDPVTGVVTILDGGPKQTFQLVATLIPHDATNYVGATSKCTINYTEGAYSGAYLMKQSNGSWVAYLASPNGTGTEEEAVFNVVENNAVVTDATRAAALLQEFKDATDIKVMGTINNFNIVQLARAIGSDWAHLPTEGGKIDESKLKTLDMSGCVMTDRFKPSLFPITRDGERRNFVNVKKFVLPRPAVGVENGTVLPPEFNRLFTDENTNNKSNIESLVIPEGWTEIEDNFSRINSIWGATPYEKLTDLKLPNSMEKIGAFAFSGFHVKVLTMPYNIHRINEGAFATSPMLQDVYFTGPAPEFVHTLAFSGVTQMCNNTVHDQQLQGKVDPDITRYEYYNGTNPRVLACLLHFPEQYRGQYTDVTREYKRLTEAERVAHGWANLEYSKGYKLYTPDGWTSTFIEQVQRKKIDWNAYVSNKVDYGVKDAYYGLDMIWPSQNQMSTGFAIAQAGYQWSGQPLRTADQYNPDATYTNTLVDRRGLYQFIIAMGNSDIDITFENDKWYTIALPFNMKVEDIKKVFGNDTQVCRFSKVTRITEGENKQIKLEFRKSVMGDMPKGSDYDGTNFATDYEHPHAEEGTGSDHDDDYYGTNKTGIIHHFPYMIKPSGTVKNEYITHDGSKWHFKGLDFERISGTLHPDIRRPEGFHEAAYTFAPILSTTKIMKNSYVLVNKDNKHKFAFYKGKLEGEEYVDGGTANQNTAYVQLPITASGTPGNITYYDWGQLDYDIFFAPQQNQAKVYTFFADDYDDAPTAIEKVVIVCGQDQVDNDKIYTINGQQVSGSHLPAGIYIKNGKKFIVK